MTTTAPSAAPRRLRLALAIVGVALLLAALLLYGGRRIVAREALTAWLRSKGVAATAEIQAIGPSGVTGSLVVGDPGRPDLTVERAEVEYGLLGLEVRSVRLVRPVLRARLQGGRLSAGALDPLIAEFRKAPPRPNAVQPRITLEGGVLLLATDYGPVRVDADAALADGRLLRLAGRTAPARLAGREVQLSLAATTFSARAFADRLELQLDAPLETARVGGFRLLGGRLRVRAAGPYPDFQRRRGDGAVAAHAEITGGRLALDGQTLRDARATAALSGQASGWLDDFALAGRAVAGLRAGKVEAAGGEGGALQAALGAENLRWTRQGGDRVQARLAATASLERYAREALKLSRLTASARGPAALDRRGLDLDLTAAALGRGAWSGLGAPTSEDSAEMAAVKRAAQGFRFAAPGLSVRAADGVLRARLIQPARLLPDRGGVVSLAPAGRGWRLVSAGGGLPKVEADVSRVAFAQGRASASGRIRAALSIGPVQDGVFDASGVLRLADGVVAFSSDRCVQVRAAGLELGENDVGRLTGRFCPAGRPLLSLGGGDWRLAGRAEEVSAEVPFLQARALHGAGAVDLGSRRGVLQAQVRAIAAEVADAAPTTRFNALRGSGEAQLAGGLWTAALSLRDGSGRPLATAALRHASESGRGRVDIATGVLRFAPGGLQPAELSPLAAAVGSPAEGEASFTGAFVWAPEAASSSGVLEVRDLDFQSPAGAVADLSGRVAFTSLAPLVAPPGQAFTAASVATPVGPVADLKLALALEPDVLRVTGGQAAVGGGLVRIESLQLPLVAGRPMQGVVDLDGVQLHDLVEASPFGDRVELDAKVSGRIPFTAQGERIRVQGGSLDAVQPGRLSIQRSALTGVAASGEVAASGAPAAVAPEPSTDTFSDFAYQAMENLAFSTLSAKVDSREDGRLAVLFHIIGKHDPPQHQEIRLSVMDLIQRRFLGRKLPLPSDTGVNLTLDTTLNLDDLLSDYAEFRRLHGSAEVQPR